MKRVSIITDTWDGNVNGVVTSLIHIKKILESDGYRVRIIHPGEFRSISLPSYSEIQLALLTRKQIGEILTAEKPDYIHIATEGPMGLAARMWCLKNKWKFTTSYYTHIPEYIQIRLKTFKNITYSYLRWFHNASQNTMVLTQSLKEELESREFKHLTVWPLGADIHLFKRDIHAIVPLDLKKPIFTFLGRLAIEKNLEAFLECDLPGSKLIIGDGPQKQFLEDKFGNKAVFVGYKKPRELARLLSISDAMVFPSKTDTFGVAILEALACGVPVAAFNVPGPMDIITNGLDGFLGNDLAGNALKCLKLDPEDCRRKAMQFSWENSVKIFKDNLVRL